MKQVKRVENGIVVTHTFSKFGGHTALYRDDDPDDWFKVTIHHPGGFHEEPEIAWPAYGSVDILTARRFAGLINYASVIASDIRAEMELHNDEEVS